MPQTNQAAIPVPFSQEAEEALIGAVLVNPKALMLLGDLRPDDFYLLRHNYIWAALEGLARDRVPVDYLTVCERLRAAGVLDEIGGPAHLTRLANYAPTSAHAPVYAELVIRAAQRRRLLEAADEIKRLALDEAIAYDDVSTGSEQALLNVINRVTSHSGRWFDDIMTDTLNDIETAAERKDAPLGITTGLKDLDQILDGLQPGKLYIIAGRPGMGKSAFIAGAVIAAAKAGQRVALFSNEMSESEVKYRMLAQESGIKTIKLRRASLLSPHENARVVNTIGELSVLPIFVDDTPDITPRVLKSSSHFLRQVWGVDAIYFDGMYRMRDDTLHKNDHQMYGEIVRQLKNLARLLHVPVIVTHQLNRAVEQRANKRPMLSDLRESGRIEEEADVVMFLYRDVVYDEASEFPNEADFIIAKQRDGGTGVIATYFEPTITKFMNGQKRQISFIDDPKPANGRRPRNVTKHYSDDL